MTIINKFLAFKRKRKLTHEILKLGITVNHLEKSNTDYSKFKLKVIKNFNFENEINELIRIIENQQQNINTLNGISDRIEDFIKPTEIDNLMQPIREKIIESKVLINSMINNFQNQIGCLRSINSNEIKLEKFKKLIKLELKYYADYRNIKKTVPIESIVQIEVEYKNKLGEVIEGKSKYLLQEKYMYPMIFLVIYGILYSVSTKEMKEHLSKMDYFLQLFCISIFWNKILTEIKKIYKVKKYKLGNKNN